MKKRTEIYDVTLGNDFDYIDRISIALNNIEVYNEKNENIKKNIGFVRQYKRDNGKEKILSKIPKIQNTDNLFHGYHTICVADTNTSIKNNMSCSAFLIGQCPKGSQEYEFIPYAIYWDSSDVEKPENYAWAVLISKVQKIIENTKTTSNVSVLLIVDSDLGNHDKFNDKTLPIIDDFYLPNNFTISYASADVDKRFPPNQLIKFCDSLANDFSNECYGISQEYHRLTLTSRHQNARDVSKSDISK